MINPKLDKAAVVPLNFGGGRVEYNVLAFGSDLDQLTLLLTNPSKYFRDTEYKYKTGVPAPQAKSWTLNPPVTAILRSGYPAKTSLIKAFQFAGFDLTQSFEDLLTNFQSQYAAGAFLAEFAVETRTVFIVYFEPISPVQTARYLLDRTPVTINTVVSGPLGNQAYAHFDLHNGATKITPVDRANFIVSYIENPDFIKSILDKRNTDFGSAVPPMVDHGQEIEPAPVAFPVGKPSFQSKVSRRTMGVSVAYPTITVESLMDGTGPVEPCTVAPLVLEGGTYEYHDILVKSY